jgi:hypothetical protein
MMEAIQTALVNTGSWLGSLDPLKAGILIFGGFFALLMWLAHRSGKLDWTDLITGKGTTKVSLTKLLQLIGGITGTWVVMYQTMHNQLGGELFFAYLAYVASIEGYSKFMAAKYGVSDSANDVSRRGQLNSNQQNQQWLDANTSQNNANNGQNPPPAPKVDDVI